VEIAASSVPVRPRSFRSAAALATVVLGLVLSGCTQTGFEAQTNASYDPGVGSNEAFGDVPVLAALVVDNGGGSGTLSATLTRRTEEPVSLTGVTAATVPSDGTQPEPIEVRFPGPLEIPANTEAAPLLLSKGSPIILTGEAVQPGRFVEVTFAFDNGQAVTLDAPVVGRPDEGGLYEDVPGGASATTEEPTDG
jgi:hypothetical protein